MRLRPTTLTFCIYQGILLTFYNPMISDISMFWSKLSDSRVSPSDHVVDCQQETCETCGNYKVNMLVKLGLVSTDLANILVQPKPTVMASKKGCKCKPYEVRWIGCLTSQLTIFQSYMWRNIDVQADWRRSSWTYGRAPNAIDISQGSLTCVPVQQPIRDQPFLNGDSYTPPQLVALYDMLGIHRIHCRLNPRALTGVKHMKRHGM